MTAFDDGRVIIELIFELNAGNQFVIRILEYVVCLCTRFVQTGAMKGVANSGGVRQCEQCRFGVTIENGILGLEDIEAVLQFEAGHRFRQ